MKLKETLLAWLKENQKVIATLIASLITALIVGLTTACSSLQRITVKQEQEGQKQETTIESDTKFKSVSFVFNHKSHYMELQ